ncbi:hypothetical protein K2X85_11340 [bacterium]|jgi:hypothetical protein|nr:hypothetical protein [bacterium]
MSEEMVTMVRGRTNSLKSLLNKHGFLWSEKGYWTRSPAFSQVDRQAFETEIRTAGAPSDLEVRDIRKAWA